MQKYKTLVVNLISGPGCGKSSIAAGVFHDLKFKGIDCEMAYEAAKEYTWEKRQFTLTNQVHVFGEQHHRVWRLLGQVEVIITDSPLLLTPIYNPKKDSILNLLAIEEFESMWNYVVFLKRCKPYNPNGRNQDEAGAKIIDKTILNFLFDQEIPFETADGTPAGKDHIVRKVLMMLGKYQRPSRKEMTLVLEP